MSTLQTIQRMIVEQFELNAEELAPEAQLEALGLDSLSVMEFMFNLEDKFTIQFPDERIEIKTLQDVSNLVDSIVA